MTEQRFPAGWDAERVKRLIDHYESMSDEEMVAEDEAAFAAENVTVIAVPNHLVAQVRALIGRDQGASRS